MNILLVLNLLDEIGSWELHTGELIKDSSQFVALRAALAAPQTAEAKGWDGPRHRRTAGGREVSAAKRLPWGHESRYCCLSDREKLEVNGLRSKSA